MNTKNKELTSAGLRVAGPALLHYALTQVRLLWRWPTGPNPGLDPSTTLAAALCPLAPHTPATWRHTDSSGYLLCVNLAAVFFTCNAMCCWAHLMESDLQILQSSVQSFSFEELPRHIVCRKKHSLELNISNLKKMTNNNRCKMYAIMMLTQPYLILASLHSKS